jgi:hypothetical protein
MAQILKTSFAKGIVGPAVYGRTDLDLYSAAVKDARNCVVRPHGGISARQGTRFVAPVKDHDYAPRLIPFQFKTTDTYIIEFGDEYVRFIRNGASVAEDAFAISDITQASPAVVEAVGHDFDNGDEVAIDAAEGMTQVNNRRFVVANVSGDTFELTDQVTGADIDSTAFDAYASGGTASRVYTLASPYAIEDVWRIKYVQNKDVITLAHPDYPIYELTRTGHTSWSFSIPTFSPGQAAPTSIAITPNTTGAVTYQYQVTAFDKTTLEESLPGLDTGGATVITGATLANPVVFSSAAHGFSVGDEVALTISAGLLGLNGVRGLITATTTDTFSLAIDTTDYDIAAGLVAASYDNPGGQGDRTAFLAVTSSITPAAGTLSNLVDGGTGANSTDSIDLPGTGATAIIAGDYFRFQFSSPDRYIDQIQILSSSIPAHGVWQIQGSDNGSTWTNYTAGGNFTWNQASQTVSLSGVPATGHEYWRMVYISGGANWANNWFSEVTFRIYGVGDTYGSVARTFKKITNGHATANNTITWDAVADAGGYNVYKLDNGVYGFIGTTSALTFTDDNIQADATDTPPQARNPFENDNNPGAVGYFAQRRVFGGTNDNPETSYYSQTGNPANMSVSAPRKDDDAITASLVAQSVNDIRHYVSMSDLIIFTGAAEWRVNSGPDSSFSAETIKQKPQTNWGSSHLRPLLVGPVTLFVEPNGSRVRSLNYDFPNDLYNSNEMSILAYNLLESYYIVDWTFAYAQDQRMHAVRNDGKMVCMTFQRDQEVVGWTYWDTLGKFEAVSALRTVTSGTADEIYMVAKRVVDGQTVRYIEVQQGRTVTDVRDVFHVDCGASYDDPMPITNLVRQDLGMGVINYLVFSAGHGLSNGDIVDISGVEWEPEVDEYGTETQPNVINGRRYEVANAATDTFTLTGGNKPELDDLSEDEFPVYADAGFIRRAGASFSGFQHLEGRTDVVVLADGDVFENLTVTEGVLTLPGGRLASRLHAGLPYLVTVETLNINAPQTQMQGRVVSASAINVMVEGSRGFVAGVPPAEGGTRPRYSDVKWRVDEDMDQPTSLFTGVKRIILENAWNTNGRFFFQQKYPLPMNILFVSPEVDLSDA